METIDMSLGNTSGRRDHSLEIPHVLSALRRHWVFIGLLGITGAVGAFAFSSAHPRLYTAAAAISIEGQSFALPELQGAIQGAAMTDPMPLVRTEMQALMSPPIVESVIAKLGMEQRAEFNPALAPPSVIHLAIERLRNLVLQTASLPPPPLSENDLHQDTLGSVMKRLVVSQDNQSLVIGLTFTSQDPALSAAFVNDLLDSYLAARANRRAAANRDANMEMMSRVDAARSTLQSLAQQMSDLRTKDALVSLRAGSIGQQQVEVLATEASQASLNRAHIEAQLDQAMAMEKSGSWDDVNNVLSSPTIMTLRDQESQASQRLADLLTQQGSNSPYVRSAEGSLQAARGQVGAEARRIISSLKGELIVLRDQEGNALQQLQAARTASVTAENAQAKLDELQRDIDAQRGLYQSLLQGVQGTLRSAAKSSVDLDIRVLNSATVPANPSSPKIKLATAMGGAGGVVLGLLVSLVRVGKAGLLSNPQDIFKVTGYPVGATLPPRRKRRTLLSAVKAKPNGLHAEALRLLRMRLRAAGRPTALRSVLFVSLDDGEEAADAAAAFASVAAGDGETVMLAEGNLRQPRLASLLGTDHTGLLTVLDGEDDWRDVILNVPAERLDVLVTRRPSKEPYALISGTAFQNLLLDLHETYSLTVLNGAAALSSDTIALAGEVNATVLIININKTNRMQAQEACAHLSTASRGRTVIAMTGSA